MQNLMSLWSALDTRRRILILGATLAMFAAVLGLSKLATTPRMALLYSGLDASAAGDVVAALDQRGAVHEVRGTAIYVDSALRDELRLNLAAEGLPAAGASGYELLDGLSGFGTTSQMFDAAYWRAKEGELARTILAIPQIRAARVHIARADPQPFSRPNAQTASVTVTTASGGLTQGQANALRHLVAAAVAGMAATDVAIIDAANGLVEPNDGTASGTGENSLAAGLKRNVERMLEARVGPGKAIVEVSVDVVTDSETFTERRLDPDSRVAISTDTEDQSDQSSKPEGQVTVASNLPAGDAAGAGGAQSTAEKSRERVNFEVSETTREVQRLPGAVRRISVAVLVDSVSVTATDGTITSEPRPDAELEVLRDLVASAVGFDEARGDTITLRSLPFQPVADQGTLAEAGMLPGFDALPFVQIAALAGVAIILGLFVLRPALTTQRLLAAPDLGPPLALSGGLSLPDAPRVVSGVIDDRYDLPPLNVISRDDPPGLPADPVARLRRLIEERQAESVEILRGWMEDREEKA